MRPTRKHKLPKYLIDNNIQLKNINKTKTKKLTLKKAMTKKMTTKLKVKPVPKLKVKPEPKLKVKSEPKLKTKPVPKSKIKSVPKLRVTSKTNSRSKSESKSESKSALKSKSKLLSSKDILAQALARVHSSSVPDSLPCRDYQFNDIYNFTTRKLFENEGGCMYISGVPGTGKTATLHEVKRKLYQDSSLPKFKFIEINGLKLAQPGRFYQHFLLELDGIKKSNYQSLDILNERFTNMKLNKDFVILFIDELDYLKTKKQDILYHIFDWPNRKNSKLIVLAVANSMDLPERFLINRISSRIGLTRLLFQPYSHQELKEIVNSRFSDLSNGFEVFESNALELICRKVSAVSGDVRRVLDICRRAIEICITNENEKVNMKSVDKALKEIFHSIKIFRIQNASRQEQIFLRALLQNFRTTGLEEYQLMDIYETHVELCRLGGDLIPNTVEFSKLVSILDLSKIILLERSHSHIYRRIRLNVSPDDVAFALNL